MHYVGVDLAWGQRNPTGLAVIDEQARLLHVSTVRSDDEIVEALAPFTDGPCAVGIDAPIVVANATGSRPAEQALSKDFRRFEAGTHPSNTGKPEFAGGRTRARVLCKRLQLDPDPRSGRARRAIEVYPHAASVVLFDLSLTLKYKAKPGRDLELLRRELLTLMGHVETIVETDGSWAVLRRQVETATRKSQLRVVEDQVDAVVCAYVALFADTRPDETTIYGDPEQRYLETGYIVTPTLPAQGVEPPATRVARRGGDELALAVQAYADDQPGLVVAGRAWVEVVTEVLDEAGINYLTVTGRTKSVTSFAEKATRRGADGALLYPDPLHDILDQVGVRVITYVLSDVAAVADLLGAQADVLDDRDMGRATASEGRFGYASRHLLLEAGADLASRRPELAERQAQVQLRTVLQHAWAEFEHEARYKGNVPPEHAHDLDRRFTLAAGLLELADQEFSAIRERLGSPEETQDDVPGAAPATEPGPTEPSASHLDPRLDPRELAAFLAGQFHDAGWSRTDHYDWIAGLLLELGITSLDELGEVLRDPGLRGLNEAMAYRFPPGAVRRLDDALLGAFGERYVDLRGNAHRRDLLAQRAAAMAEARRG
ncbi:DUF429 domain-containing protein [Nocardioides sp. GY 10127]|uniref:DUF429 domain-containing protein n=1 Tax=Nocardioides sp. GY 10127 TaxID=2569762 RepID=UPI0010A7E76A|nr:DUF429 domain-containing protein [Nocardioides sp. GY 10127]TIC86397.1 DUF429 domain-containing protein [Nocardioides sp. GY 10127]